MDVLSQENIDQLFSFVRSKYVRYYDVQLELVDHLASAIEKEMNEHPELTFKAALNKAYNKWPITGFNKFVEEKRKGLKKYWRKRFWTYLKKYFQLPKIILTITLALFFYSSSLVNIPILGIEINLLYLFLIGVGIKGYYDSHNPIIPYPTYGNEGLLTYEVFFEIIGFMLAPVAFSFYALLQAPEGLSKVLANNIYLGIGFSLLLAFSTIVLHAKGTIFKEWIEDDIRLKYPQFVGKFSKS